MRNMSEPKAVVHRMVDRSATTLILAMEPVSAAEFYDENRDGFSAAWVIGHLTCFADLFSSWFDGELIFEPSFHAVFNETEIRAVASSKASLVEPALYPKEFLLYRFQLAVVKALRALEEFDAAVWDGPPPDDVPVSLRTGGDVWEIFAAHIYWHCGQLAGSMPRFYGTYTLGLLAHHFYVPRNRP